MTAFTQLQMSDGDHDLRVEYFEDVDQAASSYDGPLWRTALPA